MSYGPWVQPADTWSGTFSTPTPSGSVAEFDQQTSGTTPPTQPDGTFVAPCFQAGTARFQLTRNTGTAMWEWLVDVGVIGVDVLGTLNMAPDSYLPPVSPSLPPNAIGIQYEATHGAANPDDVLEVTLTVVTHVIDAALETRSATATDIFSTTIKVYRAQTTDYAINTLTGTPPDEPVATRWLTPTDFAARTHVLDVPVYDGTVTSSTTLDAGTTLQGSNTVTDVITTTVSDLDSNGFFTFLSVADRALSWSWPTLPPSHLWSPNGVDYYEEAVGKNAYHNLQFSSISWRVRYTPPRYRFVYATSPPLRQMRRDDGVRQYVGNSPTSEQGSLRRIFGTYI